MKKIFYVIAMIMACTMSANAQDKVETTISADVVSKYLWRGSECGKGAIQPTLGVSYKGFSATAWGSVGIVDSNDAEELDLTVAYNTGNFTIGITDYWFSGGENKYFLYDSHKTSHVFEANLGYDFGPVALSWNTVFAGNDGLNKDGKRAYSSFVELAAPFKLGGCDWTAKVGAVPYATSYYPDAASGFAVTEVSLKASHDIKITDSFSLPIFAEIMGNPSTQKAYLAIGFTVAP